MAKDYSKGRYAAYGYGPRAPRIGWIDNDEFVRTDNGTWIFRIDGDEVYSPGGALAGFIEQDIAATPSGQFLFRLEAE
ncbi:hypothetical protein D3C78_1150340 [compost metagenome]